MSIFINIIAVIFAGIIIGFPVGIWYFNKKRKDIIKNIPEQFKIKKTIQEESEDVKTKVKKSIKLKTKPKINKKSKGKKK